MSTATHSLALARLLSRSGRSIMCRNLDVHQQRRTTTTQPEPQNKQHYNDNRMHAWQIHSFGGIDQLNLTDCERIPKLLQPNDVLVQVKYSSINPIDLAMLGGYGSALLGLARQAGEVCRSGESELRSLEFPITLGRDFVGQVVECGAKVRHLNIGDIVCGAVPPFNKGAHAQYVVACANYMVRKPEKLETTLAACVPYAGLTAWSALWAPFAEHVWPRTKVLVLGGSGGVGTIAVQMLKAWGSRVVTTCNTDAVPALESFGLEAVIDYTSPDYNRDVKMCGPYDVILNAAGLPGVPHMDSIKEWKLGRYVTLSPPLLSNSDKLGVPFGTIKSLIDASTQNLESLKSRGAITQWGFFAPSQTGLKELMKLTNEGKIKPLVHNKFKFSELPLAFKCQEDGHVRGKIIVEMDL